MPRDLSSPKTVIQVLEGLVAECRAEGITVLSIDSLERELGRLKERVAKRAVRQ